VGNRKKIKKNENGYAQSTQKYQQTVRGIHILSPEEEKDGCGGNDLQNWKIL